MCDVMSCILSDEEVTRAQRFKSFHTVIDSVGVASHVPAPRLVGGVKRSAGFQWPLHRAKVNDQRV